LQDLGIKSREASKRTSLIAETTGIDAYEWDESFLISKLQLNKKGGGQN
jgi:hypothetical protein